jgi:L-histidine Nalpha-methyltransferase / hercynylcysteine S-oxide synthase
MGEPFPNNFAMTLLTISSHLVNEGVEETPPSRPGVNGFSNGEHTLSPNNLFINLEGCNIGFQNWHPMPVTQNGNRLSGQGEMGGVWEWTSSHLEKHDGYKPMDLYPAYTCKYL